MSYSELTRLGKTALAEKKYDDALRLFSQALALCKGLDNAQAELLELRCQTYSKLGKLELALQDARHMIHASNRRSSTGYLRCSQIERLLGNHDAAIKWLEHGIKNVPIHQQIFRTQLQKVRVAASKEVSMRKQRDPIALMPLEILQLVISDLNHRETVILLRVSKTWRNTFSRIPPLTIDIDFSGARKAVSYQGCTSALKRLCRYPRKLNFGRLSQPACQMAETWLLKRTNIEPLQELSIGQTGVKLSSLHFQRMKYLTYLHVGEDQQVTLDQMQTIINECQSLQTFVVHNLKPTETVSIFGTPQMRLQDLRIDTTTQGQDIPFSLLKQYPNLQNLRLHGMTFLERLDDPGFGAFKDFSLHRHLRSLDLKIGGVIEKLNLPESLVSFHCESYWDSTLEVRLQPNLNLPNLKRIALVGVANIDEVFNTLGQSHNPPQLQEVHLHDNDEYLEDVDLLRGGKCTQLCRKLSLHSQLITDQRAEQLATLFPVIEELSLEGATFSGVFISDLVRKPSCQLQQIVLRDCFKVSSDIESWLKSKNISCRSISTADQRNGTRRIREMW